MIGLTALISPHSVDDFLTSSWPGKPFVVHGLQQSISELTEIPFLQSLETLLNSWPQSVSAHLPDVADEASAIDTTPQNARKLFNNKMSLLFNNVHSISPVLEKWLKQLSHDLGLPRSTLARCTVYATPDGKGTAPHFDQNVNFVLQLHGTKKWWLEENLHVENPTERFTMGQPMDPELAIYAAKEMPTTMSQNASEFILKPGSLLFVPRGYWHRTEATGEALALNFTFNQPAWVDLLTLALRSRLLQSAEWRELADGVSSRDSARRHLATETFEFLLTDLIDDLPNWTAADILGATEGPSEYS